MLTLLTLCIVAQSQTETVVTPFFKRDPLSIRSVKTVQPVVGQFEIEELKVDLGATFDNPFDPSDISLDASVTTPSGNHYSMPGFFFRDFNRSLATNKEVLTTAGEPDWRVRLCPTEVGDYQIVVSARDRSGSTHSEIVHFTAKTSKGHGFVRISPKNHSFFDYSDGSAFYPLGANVAWGNDRGTFSYDDWIPAYGKVGANYMRVWLGPAWVTFGLEQGGKPEEGKGLGLLDLGNAWRLDRVMGQAAENGLNVMVTIDSYNTLRAHNAYPAWDKSPYNKDNGGPIRIWTDFWTNSAVDRSYKAKLRYLIGRYSAFSNLMSWEFWNEVDLTEDYSVDVVQAWHQRMGDYLRNLDPYHHLVTTSQSDSMGNRNIDLLPQIDYIQTHSYNNPDVAGGVLYQQSRKAEWGKPHYVGEIGADASGPRADEDPQGLQVHDPVWMSLVTGSSGSAMSWWWDSLIAPKNLYPLFGAAAAFIKGIDWPSEDFRRANVEVGYRTPPARPEMKDLVFEGGPIPWNPSEASKPHTVSIIKGKVEGDTPLPGIQHGIRNHQDLHNPVRFRVKLEKKTTFEVRIGDVSGYGGATLQISIDGDPVLTREFRSGENAENGQSLAKFSGKYDVEVSAGDHVITVENIGNDWFMVGYRFLSLTKRTGPALQCWALEGNNTAILWARPEGRTWKRVIVDKVSFPEVPESIITLEGLGAGTWTLEAWDTWKGTVISTKTIKVGINGKAKLPVPSFTKDLALKLTKLGH